MPKNSSWTQNSALNLWIDEMAALCRPAQIHLCDGTEAEYDRLAKEMVRAGTLVPLKRPGSFWCHSHPDDVARVEESTFICSKQKEDAGPTNNDSTDAWRGERCISSPIAWDLSIRSFRWSESS